MIGACPCSARHWHEDCAALIIGILLAQQAWPWAWTLVEADAQHVQESQPLAARPSTITTAATMRETRLMRSLEHRATGVVKTKATQPIQSPSSRTCQPCGTRFR